MNTFRSGTRAAASLILAAAATAAASQAVLGQPGAQHGQSIAPVYEGFASNADGSFDLLFGYFNRNWSEEIDLPIGRDNSIEPGGPDQGQPTHFFPRRNQFVFRVRVPADFGDNEIVWTLTSHDVTARAYGTLRTEYAVDDTVMQANFGGGGSTGFRPDTFGNIPPQLTVEGDTTRSVSAGEPVTLRAVATDDGKPERRSLQAGRTGFLPNAATGLRLSWFRYRGPSVVTFDPPQAKVWEDYRPGGNSPWSPGWGPPPIPPDNRWVVRVTFSEPGTYVLRCLAHDGGLQSYDDVTFHVTR